MFTEEYRARQRERRMKILASKTSTSVIIYVLLALGILFIVGTIVFQPNQKFDSTVAIDFFSKLGNGLIVGSITAIVLLQIRRKLENIFDIRSEMIDDAYGIRQSQKQLINDISKTGIKHIYTDRGTTDHGYKKSLIEHLKNTPKGGTVKIIGVTLARFFGPNYDREILSTVLELLQRGVKFQLLLLDPRSKAARQRANIDQEDVVDEHGYLSSTIFKDSLSVIRRIKKPTVDWCIDKTLFDNISNQIELRLYDTNPVLHLIILKKYTFVEQYHNGGGDYVRDVLKKTDNYSNLPNYTGFVPVFKVNRFKVYGELMYSHFQNIWDSDYAKSNSIKSDKVYERAVYQM